MEDLDSGLQIIVTNVTKMKLLEQYIDSLPLSIKDDYSMKRFKDNTKVGDIIMIKDSFDDLNQIQKTVVTALLKTLAITSEWKELEGRMNIALAHIIANNHSCDKVIGEKT